MTQGVRRIICTVLATAILGAASTAPATAAVEPWQKGANFTAWWHDAYEQPQSDAALRALAATGTTRVSIVTTWYMDTPQSSDVRPLADKTPSDASVLHAMSTAQDLGMEVVLKPHVDVLDGTFRADIAPANRAAWFDSYRQMSNRYAQLAADGGAKMLIVGTELTSMSADEADWRRTIAEARTRFGGALTFAANWTDGAQRIAFWDALDFIGVDAYMPLADTDDPPVEALTAAWRDRGYVSRLEELHNRFGKPVLFTELGYQSRVDTATRPWGGATGAIDQGPQARAYEAAFRAFWDVPWFAGIYWWDWSATGSRDDPGGYTFSGTAAEQVAASWYARPRTEPAPATPPAASTTPVTPDAAGRGARPLSRSPLVSLRVAHKRVLGGTVQRNGAPCRTRITLRVRSLSRRASHRPGSTRTTTAGAFRFSLHGLARGRYRAQAVVSSGACGRAHSRKVAFRV
jgi:hypothetical protein